MYAALSYDEGKHGRKETTDGQVNIVFKQCLEHGWDISMDENHAEPRGGYLAGTQTPDNVVHIQ